MTMKVVHTPPLDRGTPEAKRDEIRHYFQTTWELYEKLFGVMACDEACFLRARLEPEFRLAAEPRDVEFVIRETARKFQHTAGQMTVWGKTRSIRQA